MTRVTSGERNRETLGDHDFYHQFRTAIIISSSKCNQLQRNQLPSDEFSTPWAVAPDGKTMRGSRGARMCLTGRPATFRSVFLMVEQIA